MEYGLDLDRVETQVDEVIAKTFMAATRQPIHFQTRPNCWEIFGVDLLVDEDMKVWLLEINAVSFSSTPLISYQKKTNPPHHFFFSIHSVQILLKLERLSQIPSLVYLKVHFRLQLNLSWVKLILISRIGR